MRRWDVGFELVALRSHLGWNQRSWLVSLMVFASREDGIIFTVIQFRFSGGDIDSYIRKRLDILFQLQASLYVAGARNFLFIDVPPLHLSPIAKGKTKSSTVVVTETCHTINR